MEGDSTSGQAKNPIYMKESSWRAKEMAGEPSGGRMEAGMKANSETGSKAAMEPFSERAATKSMKVRGTTECSMERGPNSSRTVKNTKDRSSRTNSTETAYFTRTTQ